MWRAQKSVLRSLVDRLNISMRTAGLLQKWSCRPAAKGAALVKQARLDSSGCRHSRQVRLQANVILEPSDNGAVDMLSALPPREASVQCESMFLNSRC